MGDLGRRRNEVVELWRGQKIENGRKGGDSAKSDKEK